MAGAAVGDDPVAAPRGGEEAVLVGVGFAIVGGDGVA